MANTKILAEPVLRVKLLLYLVTSDSAISVVLVQAKGQTHLPIYFFSYALNEVENRYPPLEKLAYAQIMSVRKLRLYFFCYRVEVLMSMLLGNILHWPDTAG